MSETNENPHALDDVSQPSVPESAAAISDPAVVADAPVSNQDSLTAGTSPRKEDGPPSSDTHSSRAFYHQGLMLLEQGKYAAADESFDRAIQIDPLLHKAWLLKSRCLIALE